MALALACAALFSVLATEKRSIVHQTRKLLNPREAKKTKNSLRETEFVLSLPHKRSRTKTPSDDQWHELQWQQDR